VFSTNKDDDDYDEVTIAAKYNVLPITMGGHKNN